MKFQITVAALLAGIASFVHAQDKGGIYFTNPVEGAVFNAGTSQLVSWKLTNYVVTDIESLELRHGNAQNLELIQIINKKPIPVNLNQYVWDIPANATTDNTYVLMAKDSYGYSYSTYFTIIGNAANGDSTSTSAVTATAVPSEEATAAPSQQATSEPSAQALVARDSSDANSIKASTIAFAIAMGATLVLM